MAFGSWKPRNQCSDSAWKMGVIDMGLKKSSKLQHGSKTIKEVVFPEQVKESRKHHDKLKGKSRSGWQYSGPPRQLRQSASSGCHQQESDKPTKTTRDDELVRYMSNLPSYLQHLETGDQMQDKAFNVGVLDWSRLERWKDNQTCAPASKRSIRPATFCKEDNQEDIYCQSKPQSSVCLDGNLSSSCNDVTSLQTPSKIRLEKEKAIPMAYKSFGDAKGILENGKIEDLGQSTSSTSANHLSESRYEGAPRRTKYPSAWDRETFKRLGTHSHACNQKTTSIAGASSSKPNVLSTSEETKKTREVFLESSNGLASGPQPVDSGNIVLLVPRKVPKVSSSEGEPHTSLCRTSKESDPNTCSGRFDDSELHSPEKPSKVPYSCPMPTGRKTTLKPCNERRSSSAHADQSSDSSQESKCMQKVPASLPTDEVMKNNAVATDENGGSRTLNLEMVDSASRKGSHPSPNRRFSFGLSRMTRSFSFKETSSAPQLSAAYVPRRSGPVTSKAFPCSEDLNKDKANVHIKARASPLRRILDPLLKSRGSTKLHSFHANPPLKSNLDSLDMAHFLSTKSPQGEVHGKSIMQGRLLLMMKNGHPMFRLAVDNNRNVLAATKTTAASPVKNDSGCSYTIYAIEEIKKKSGGWMSQAIKEKSSGIVYNVVGHMNTNTSSSVDFPRNSCTNQPRVRESVLFGVDLRQSDPVSPRRELAAIVITRDEDTESLHDMEYLTKTFFQTPSKSRRHCNLQSKNHCNSTTVILPGAVHGLPNKGDPSPLIERWRSGGLCDCGGWDVGCKLCVLSNGSHHFQSSKIPDYSQTSDHLELVLQGEDQSHEPVFSLTLLDKGEYSVTFSSSISLLQAFFICVTVISCQASPCLAEASNLFEDKVRREFSAENEREKKTHASTPAHADSKYAPCPPLSPVSRV